MIAGGRAALAELIDDILDAWVETADEQAAGGNAFAYARKKSPHRLLHMPLEPEIGNLGGTPSALRGRPLHARRGTERRPEGQGSLRQHDRERGRSRMTKNAQRLSQLISTFGPGAMIDLPTRSVIVGGLEQWDMKGDAFTTIPEPRLTMRLEQILKDQGRLDPATALSLRTPPPSADGRDGHSARRRRSRSSRPGSSASRWRPSHCRGQNRPAPAAGALAGSRYQGPAKVRIRRRAQERRDADPFRLRLRQGPSSGHRLAVGRPRRVACQEPMWVEEKGTSADPADTSIVCGCGRSLSLQETFQPGRLGKCRGERPWLLDRDPDGCGENLKLLTRTATNTYFPQVLYGHLASDRGRRADPAGRRASGDLTNVQSVQDVAQAKRFNPKVSASLGPYSDERIFDRLQRIREGARVDANRSPKLSEFDTFASGRPEIGHNHPAAKLYAADLAARRLGRSGCRASTSRRSRTSSPFTACERSPASTASPASKPRRQAPMAISRTFSLRVRGAPISRDADWLPAIEQFGEGIFIHFDEVAIARWLQRGHGAAQSEASCWLWSLAKALCGKRARVSRTPYVLLHSISHALMAEIALDCGYPASSLKERVYALSGSRAAVISTAAAS